MRSFVARYLGGYRQVEGAQPAEVSSSSSSGGSSSRHVAHGNGSSSSSPVVGVSSNGSAGNRGGADVEMASHASVGQGHGRRQGSGGGGAGAGAGVASQNDPDGAATDSASSQQAAAAGSAGPGPGSVGARWADLSANMRRVCWDTPLAFGRKLVQQAQTLGLSFPAGGILMAVAFVLLFSALISQNTPPPQTGGSTVLDVWLVAGQSNAVGANDEDGQALPEVCSPLLGRILRFSPSGRWEDAVPNIHNGVHNYSQQGVGPAMAFARTLLDLGAAQRVGLVPTAMVGSGLAEHWMPPFSPLYKFLVSQAHTAVLRTPGAQLRGILWVQGETDGKDESMAQSYSQNLHTLIMGLRYDLADITPRGRSLMLVMGVMAARDQHSRLPWLPYLGEVRLQQQRFMVDHLVKVDMSGYEFFNQSLPNHPAGLVHLTKAGQGAFGIALAHAVNEYRLGAALQAQALKDKANQDKQNLLAQQGDEGV